MNDNRHSFSSIKTVAMQSFAFFSIFCLMQHCLCQEKNSALITMHTEETTLERFAQELSKQSGKKYLADSFLRLHPMSVHATAQSAENLLSAIMEMNDWRSVQKENGDILITHRIPPIAKTIQEIPRGVYQLIPKSWLTFLGDEFDPEASMSDSDLSALINMKEKLTAAQNQDERQSIKEDIRDEIRSLKKYRAMNKISSRGSYNPVSRLLFPTVPQALIDKKKYPYSQWSKSEKDGVNTLVFLQFIEALRRERMPGALLSDKILNIFMHPEITTFSIRGSFFSVEERSYDGKKIGSSFAVEIVP